MKSCDLLFDFVFYLPCGGEKSFRETCVKFAGLVNEDRILDLCCGNGELTTIIAGKGFIKDLVGVDISESVIKIARTKNQYTPVTFIRASANDLPLDSSRFTKCFISFGLHHMSRHERTQTLVEAHRILVPKGTLYVIDYNLPQKGLRRLAAIAFAKLDESKEAYRMLKDGDLIKEVQQAGFEIVRRELTCQDIVQLLAAVKN